MTSALRASDWREDAFDVFDLTLAAFLIALLVLASTLYQFLKRKRKRDDANRNIGADRSGAARTTNDYLAVQATV